MYGPLFYVHSVGWFTTSISKLDWVIGALIKLLLIRSLEHRMVVVLQHTCFTYWQRKAAAAQRQPIKQQQPAVSNKEPPTAVTRSGPQATQPRQSQEQTTQVHNPVSVRAHNTNQEEIVLPNVKVLSRVWSTPQKADVLFLPMIKFIFIENYYKSDGIVIN